MCGVSGFIGPSEQGALFVKNLVDAHTARGPDHAGIETVNLSGQGTAIIGHNRLAIVDESENANQPMFTSERRYVLSFNGEIYNYLELRSSLVALGHNFETESDTEVLLLSYVQWGQKAWTKLRGAFAVAIFDSRTGSLILTRSRFGSKPLSYAHFNNGILFASMSEAIARVIGADVDYDELLQISKSWVFEKNKGNLHFKNIHNVAPGTSIVFRIGNPSYLVSEHYWYDLKSLKYKKSTLNLDEFSIEKEFLSKFRESVRIRAITNTKCGLSLSGGLDSSCLAAVASIDLNYPLECFVFSSQRPNNEQSNVEKLVDALGQGKLNVNYVFAPSRDDMERVIRQTLAAQGGPFGSFSVFAQNLLFQQARKKNIKVMLGGQGADEVLMGYQKYIAADLLEAFKSQEYYRFFTSLISVSSTMLGSLSSLKSSLQAFQRPRAGGRNIIREASNFSEFQSDFLRRISIADLMENSLPSLLKFEDRNSMSFGVETRVPFLDHDFVEYCLGLSDNLKVRHGFGKWILRKSMENILPKEILWNRHKRGFDSYGSEWLANGAGKVLKEIIREVPDLTGKSGISPQIVDTVLRASNEEILKSRQIQSLLITLSWLAQWISSGNESD